jgi:hypothetical protein
LKYACRARKIEKVIFQNVRETKSNEELRREVENLQKELNRRNRGCNEYIKE